MELKDRIDNIKKILSYCGQGTHKVNLYNDKYRKYLVNLFTKDKRFKTPFGSEFLIHLATHLNSDYKDMTNNTIYISYCYNYSCGEEDWDSVYFEDPWVTCNYKRWFGEYEKLAEYSDLPDDFWELTQNLLVEYTKKGVNR